MNYEVDQNLSTEELKNLQAQKTDQANNLIAEANKIGEVIAEREAAPAEETGDNANGDQDAAN